MSNLSELLPSGGGQNNVEFTASGAVASGKPVILNSDGTVTEIAETTISPDAPIGSRTLVDGNNTEYLSIAADPHNSNRWAAVYMDDIGNKDLFIKIFTRSGTTITQSSAISLVTGGSANRDCSVAFDKGTADKVLIMYNDNTNDGVVQVGTISGSAGSESVSLGTATDFHTAAPIYTALQKGCRALICLDTSGNYMGIWHNYSGTIDARIFQVSGTSVTAGGSDVTVASNFYSAAGSEEMDIVGHYSDTSKVYFGYKNTSKYLETKLLTVSGTSITVGTGYANSNFVYNAGLSLNPISDTKIIATYSEDTNDYPSYQVITDNGSGAFTYGTSTVVQSNYALTTISRNSSTNPLTIPFYYNSNRGSGDKPFVRILTSNSDASTITVSSEDQIDTNTIATNFNGMQVQGDDSAHYLMLGEYSSDLYFILGKAGGTSTNLSATSFIGLASAAISDTAAGDINVKGGINEAQTGLTIGSDYYVQSDGTLATTADTPSVKVGQAISATTINMMDLT